MVIARAAIDAFLDKPVMYLPAFKGADPQSLERSIYDSTGQWLFPKTEQRDYQLEGVAFALWLRRALLFYDMRMGKTKMALDYAEHLRRSNLFRKKGLVIAHSPLGLQVWQREAEKHTDLKVSIVHLDADDFVAALDDDTDLIVLPVSGLQELFTTWGINDKTQKRKLYANHELVADFATEFDLCIIDEIHMHGDKNSLRFQIAAGLTEHCNFRLGLTGTPFGRDPFKLWAQAYLIDRGVTLGRSYYFFEQAFGIGRKNWFSKFMQYKFDRRKLPVLESKMSTVAMMYKRSEVAAQTVWQNQIELYMSGDQRDAYRDVVNKLVRLRGEEDAIEILSTFHRLRQVSSGYLPFTDQGGTQRVVHFKSNPKLEWLSELVELQPDVPIIIFHDYTHSGRMICDMLTKHKQRFGWLYGGVSTLAQANKIVADFQSGATPYLVANAAKGGMSIDLPQCDYLIYYEAPASVITRRQSEARPMARGTRPLLLDDLVASPVEARILDFYADNKSLTDALSGVRVRRSLALAVAPIPTVRNRVPAA